MKKSLLYMAACAALLAGCQNDVADSVLSESSEFSGVFDKEESRVYLGDDYFYRWEAGDLVSVFTADNRNRQYKAKTSDVIKTDFEFVSKPSTGEASFTMTSNYAVFPYHNLNCIAMIKGAWYTIASQLAAEQVYDKDKNSLDYAIMVSKIPASEEVFEFKNSCSLIKLNVKASDEFVDEATIQSITVESKKHKLAGTVTIDVEKDDYTAEIMEGNGAITASNSVKMTGCSEAGTVGTDYITFYLVIPAGTYEAGDLTITIDTDKDALDKTASTSKEYTVARSEYIELNATLDGDFQGTFAAYQVDEQGNITIGEDFTLTEQSLVASSELASLGYNTPNSLVELPSGAYTIDGNGHTITFEATDGDKLAINTFVTTGYKNKVTVNDLTIAGEVNSTLLGIYRGSTETRYETELNNVNIINTKSASLSNGMGAAAVVYGTAVLNDCNIYGTTRTSLETSPLWPLYDLAVVNYSTTTLNGGKYGSIYTWTHCAMTIKAKTEVGTIYWNGVKKSNTDNILTLESGAKVTTLNVTYGNSNYPTLIPTITIKSGATVSELNFGENVTNFSGITIEDGATVSKIVVNNEEKTLEQFKALQSGN